MSQSNDSTQQDLLQIMKTGFIYDCLTIAVVALSLYEYLITLGEEVEVVWRRKTKFSLPSVLLVSTRLSMLLSAITSAIPSPSTCTGLEALSVLASVVTIAGCLQLASFSALRVSALYNRNIALFISILALGLIPVGTNSFGLTRLKYMQEPGMCIQDSEVSDALARKLVLLSHLPSIVIDILVLVLTWAKTYQQILYSRLLICLSRDGTFYFLALLIVNILQIATHRTHLGTPLSIPLATLPPILINRFMLNLSQACDSTSTSDTGNPNRSLVSTLGFQLSEQTVGSMGEPLDNGDFVVFQEHDDEVFEERFGTGHEA